MLKNTVTGSFLAKLMPTMSKYFLENASQDDVNKAEQEAAVLHQQMQGNGITPPVAPVAVSTSTEAVTPPVAPVVPAPIAPVAAAPVALEAPTVSPELTAMTTRATTAESQVVTLTAQITTLTADRDRYKAWHDTHSNKATALPATDRNGGPASNRGGQSSEPTTLSTASSSALEQFLRKGRTTSRA